MSEERLKAGIFIDPKPTEVFLTNYGKAVAKTEIRALNRTLNKADAHAKRLIRKVYNIKLKDLKGPFDKKKATTINRRARIVVTGFAIPLSKFSAKQFKKGVKVKVKKAGGSKLLPGRFFVQKGRKQKITKTESSKLKAGKFHRQGLGIGSRTDDSFKRNVQGAFSTLADPKKVGVFERDENYQHVKTIKTDGSVEWHGLPIHEEYGPAVPQMFDNKDNMKELDKFVEETYDEEFDKALTFELSKF
jgi:hypothetical protein